MGWKCGSFIFSLIIQIPIDIYQVLTKGDKQILSTQNTNIYGDMYLKFGKSIPELKTIDKGKLDFLFFWNIVIIKVYKLFLCLKQVPGRKNL